MDGVSNWFIASSVLGSTPCAMTILPVGAASATAGRPTVRRTQSTNRTRAIRVSPKVTRRQPLFIRGLVERGEVGARPCWLVERPQRLEDGERALEEFPRVGEVVRSSSQLGLRHERLRELVPGSDLLEDARGSFQVAGRGDRIFRGERLAQQPVDHAFEMSVTELLA